MRLMVQIVGLMFILFIAGCSSTSERSDVNRKTASVANSELGVAYLSRGQYKVAMVKLKKAIDFDEENSNAHHYIAELYRRLEQNDLAAEHFNIALKLKPNDSSIKNNYGIFLCGTGSFDEGLKVLNTVLADPLYIDKAQAYENMGLCAEKQGNVQAAEQYFLTALKFNSQLRGALLGLATIEFDKNNLKSASLYFEQHNKISQHTPQSLWLGVLIEREKGRKGQSGSYAILLKNRFPDSKEAKFLKKLKIR